MIRADGRYDVINSLHIVSGREVIYNLTVAQDHTYTVGDGQWVVHNTGRGCGSTTKYIDRNGVAQWARIDDASADFL